MFLFISCRGTENTLLYRYGVALQSFLFVILPTPQELVWCFMLAKLFVNNNMMMMMMIVQLSWCVFLWKVNSNLSSVKLQSLQRTDIFPSEI